MGSEDRRIGVADKSFPADAAGRPLSSFLAEQPALSSFSTPLFVLDDAAMTHNIDALAEWVAERGLELMPHGKTTMAPALWQRQLDAGATGITVATGWQARVALDAGVPFVQLANSLVDPVSIAALGAQIGADSSERLVSWVDSLRAIELMEEGIVRAGLETMGVLVELGATGGRTGARSAVEAVALAERVVASPVLRLMGVAGYEGALGHDRSDAAVTRIEGYLGTLVSVALQLRDVMETSDPMLTAGGSAYPDLVAAAFAEVSDYRRVLRSGAYLVHDSGFYESISPFDRGGTGNLRLRPAMWGFARVISHPEPGIVLLDAGKRDLPFDEGLPRPVAVSATLGGSERPLQAEVTALNDQHTFLSFAPAEGIEVGDVIRLGLSHPCTAFDKWRLIPVVREGIVVDAVETVF